MLNRSIQPSFNTNYKVSLGKLNTHTLNNNVPIHYLQNETLEVFRLEIVFRAGSYFGKNFGDSYFTSKMLTAGTKFRSSAALVEHFDNYGGFFEIIQNSERMSLMLHGLSKYMVHYLPMIAELMYDPSFPEDELQILKKISSQNYLINKEKTAFEASAILRKKLYGNDHSFGKTLDIKEIEIIGINDISEFYNNRIKNNSFEIYLTGKVSQDDLEKLEVYFGHQKVILNDVKVVNPIILPKVELDIDKPDGLQKTLRFGKRLFNRKHPDFYKFIVFNTLLGGFFGSRLMKNIREEKGYTYGINSSLSPFADEGIFSIGSDVKKEFYENAISEVYSEINILKTKEPAFEELETVKNYMKGSILGGMNNIFDLMDKHKAIKYENLDSDFYDTILFKIEEVNASDMGDIANKYMDDLCVISVG